MMPIIIYRIKDIFSPVANTWDKLSPTEEEAINFAHTYINQEPKKMIDATHYSLEYCLDHSRVCKRCSARYCHSPNE